MRRQFSTLLLLFSFFLFGCQTNPDDVDPPPAENCKIKSANVRSGTIAATEFFYGSDGKLVQYKYGDTTCNFTYNGNTILRELWENGILAEDVTITLNPNGFITNIRDDYDFGWINEAYEYSGDQVMKSTRTTNSGGAYVVTYTWSNGNMIKSNTPLTETTFDYYLDKQAMDGDFDWLQNTLTGGKIIRSKNLMKSQDLFQVNYTSDSVGKITEIIFAAGTTSEETIFYDYECH